MYTILNIDMQFYTKFLKNWRDPERNRIINNSQNFYINNSMKKILEIITPAFYA